MNRILASHSKLSWESRSVVSTDSKIVLPRNIDSDRSQRYVSDGGLNRREAPAYVKNHGFVSLHPEPNSVSGLMLIRIWLARCWFQNVKRLSDSTEACVIGEIGPVHLVQDPVASFIRIDQEDGFVGFGQFE